MTKKTELKGGSFTLSVLQLFDNDLESAATFLEEKIKQAPTFFENAPLVIDISRLEKPLDFKVLKEVIDNSGMIAVGISGCKNFELRTEAKKAGLAILNPARTPKKELKKAKKIENIPEVIEVKQTEQSDLFITNQTTFSNVIDETMTAGVSIINTPSVRSKIITTPVRSGQQVYAKDADLIVLNHVSAGAEIISDGCIHVYGILRGRAIAGANGNTDAYIFCQNLQPELVSVAGHYWISDTIPEKYVSRAVKISLDTDTLNIDYLTV